MEGFRQPLLPRLPRRQPARAILAQFRHRPRLIGGAIFRAERFVPAAIGAAIDEGGSAAFPEGAARRGADGGMVLHIAEAAMVEDIGPDILIHLDLEEIGDAADRGRQIALHLREMQQHHIGQVVERPPATDMIPERPQGMSVLRHPVVVILPHRGRRALEGRADAAGRVVERIVKELVAIEVVVIEAPHHIAPIAADIEVFRPRREDQRVDRQMRLHEAPMGLRLQRR